jgi:valyl-tRNA synthetase
MDTWATSSLTPQIVGRWLPGASTGDYMAEGLYQKVFPFSLRPQAHEIIRTWAFYTLLKSYDHFDTLPWKDVLISGWGIAGEGKGKISKSRGGGPMAPMEMLERYSADAVRYWAASTAPGKDAVISEEKIQMGARLATKLWNVARFSERFLEGYLPSSSSEALSLTTADQWMLSRSQALLRRVTGLFQNFASAEAKSEVENFFWRDLADNYLEMCKQRLYDPNNPWREGARFTLYHILLITLKLFAPLFPYVTEEIYRGLFAGSDHPAGEQSSIHTSAWPRLDPSLEKAEALEQGEMLIAIATAVRRYKSEHNRPLGSEIARLQLAIVEPDHRPVFQAAILDLMSVCRARQVEILDELGPGLEVLSPEGNLRLAIEP